MPEELDTEIVEDEEVTDGDYSKAQMASRGTLNHLHTKLAEYMIEQLESGEELSSGNLAVIAGFLKNNNITADITPVHSPISITSRFARLLKEAAGDDEE